jgi:hypothetical protein
MSRRRGYRDITTMGHSKLAPFAYTHSQRSDIRMRAAVRDGRLLRQWVESVGGTLDIKNDGHHWIVKLDARCFEWWPSSAKLVIDKMWQRGIHAHDIEQVMKVVGGVVAIPEAKVEPPWFGGGPRA